MKHHYLPNTVLKLFIVFALFFINSHFSFGQKNIISITPIGIITGKFYISYERQISTNNSLVFNSQFWSIDKTSSGPLSPTTHRTNTGTRFGFEFRRNFRPKRKEETGLYCGIRIFTGTHHISSSVSTQINVIKNEAKIISSGGGIRVGSQYKKKNFVADFSIFFGKAAAKRKGDSMGSNPSDYFIKNFDPKMGSFFYECSISTGFLF